MKRCTSAGVLGSACVSCNRKKTTNDASVKGASEVLVIHQLISAQVLQVAELLAGDRSSGYVRLRSAGCPCPLRAMQVEGMLFLPSG